MCLRSKACRPVHLAAADDPAFRRCGAAPAAAVHLPLPSGVAARHLLQLCSCPCPRALRRGTCCSCAPALALRRCGAALAVAVQLWCRAGCCSAPALALRRCGAALAVALQPWRRAGCCSAPALALRRCGAALAVTLQPWRRAGCCSAPSLALRRCGTALAVALQLWRRAGCCSAPALALRRCGAALAVALHLLLPSGVAAPHGLLPCTCSGPLTAPGFPRHWLHPVQALLLQGRCHLPSAVKCTFGPGDRSSSGGRRQARDFCTPWCEAVWPSYPGHAQPVPAALSPSAVCSGCAFCLLLAAVETHRFRRLQSKLATMQPPIKAGYNAASKNWLELRPRTRPPSLCSVVLAAGLGRRGAALRLVCLPLQAAQSRPPSRCRSHSRELRAVALVNTSGRSPAGCVH